MQEQNKYTSLYSTVFLSAPMATPTNDLPRAATDPAYRGVVRFQPEFRHVSYIAANTEREDPLRSCLHSKVAVAMLGKIEGESARVLESQILPDAR